MPRPAGERPHVLEPRRHGPATRAGARWSGHPVRASLERSPHCRATRAREVRVKLDRKVRYELDGGTRPRAKRYRLAVEPGAIPVRVPSETTNGGGWS